MRLLALIDLWSIIMHLLVVAQLIFPQYTHYHILINGIRLHTFDISASHILKGLLIECET